MAVEVLSIVGHGARAMRLGRVVHGVIRCLTVAACAVAAFAVEKEGLPDARPPEAILLPVRLPLTGTRDTQIRSTILRQLDRLRGQPNKRGILVLRFDAGPADNASASDFGRALELARFLTSGRLAGVKTVAWLPEGTSGHAVLVALACDTIAMPPAAELGPANVTEPVVDDAMRAAYREIASRRRTVPPAVAVAFIDPALRVLRVTTDSGSEFVAEGDLAEVRARAAVVATEKLEPVPLALTGRRARELGFVNLLASSPAELARGLGVAERSLVADPSLEGGWKGVQVSLSGGIGPDAVSRLRNRIERAVSDGANFICLRIDSAGGSPEQSLVLANWLAGLDPARVRTVAWVPREARGDAALVALACDEIVMNPAAVLGGEGAAAIDKRRADAIAVAWRGGVAKLRDRAWSLPLATVIPEITVRRAEQQGTGRVEFFSEEELAARKDRDEWRLGGEVGRGPLMLTGRRAEELGLVPHLADDLAGLRRAYGLDEEMGIVEPGWADELLAALASPSLAWLLLLIGGAGLYIELKTPGVGFGGFVAMVAFIVYFWSQYLNGTAGWLEVMLFLAGFVCVLAEIFVLPGFGVLGLGGGLLVIASLVLASQSFVLPANDYQLRQMQWSLFGILAAVAGVATLAAVVHRWLPSTPGLRMVLLEPPAPDGFDDHDIEALIGVEGITTTRLAMAGKARIAGEVRDVASDGMLVEPGRAVRVVEVRGGRLIVRPVTDA
jgi:membrane-bound ClpP family serine protease